MNRSFSDTGASDQRLDRMVESFRSHERFFVSVILVFLLCIPFYKVFLGQTLVTAAAVAGVMPSGPYGYSGPTTLSRAVGDVAASAWQLLPLSQKIHQSYVQGEAPLWNPNAALGMPLAADLISSAFSPLKLPLFLWPSPLMWDIYLLSVLFVAGFSTYLYMRLLGIGLAGALTSAIAFMLTGYVVAFYHISHMDVECFIPLLLYAAHRLLQRQDRRSMALLGLVAGVMFLAGYPVPVFLALFLVSSYYVLLLGATTIGPGKKGIRVFTRGILRYVAGIMLGSGMGAMLLIPGLEFLSVAVTQRSTTMGWIYVPLKSAIEPIVPGILDDLKQPDVFSWWQAYLGVTVILPALIAVLGRTRYRVVVWFFTIFGAFCVLKITGIVPAQWIAYLPGFNRIIYPKYIQPELAISAAVLAGIGVQTLQEGAVRLRSIALCTIVTLAVAIGFFAFHIAAFRTAGTLASAGYRVAAAAVFGSAFVALGGWLLRGPSGSRWQPFLAAGLVFVELGANVPQERAERYDPFSRAPYIDFLKSDRERFRMLGLDGVLHPEYSSAFDIDDVRWLSALGVDRYVTFVREFVSRRPFDRFTGEEDLGAGFQPADRRLLDLLNVKYLLAVRDPVASNFIDRVLAQGRAEVGHPSFFGKVIYRIDDKTKPVLFAHPPANISYAIKIPQKGATLKFSLALDPQVWQPHMGEGVQFEVWASRRERYEVAFSRYIDPKNTADRQWSEGTVDLSRYRGKTIALELATFPGVTRGAENNSFDWAWWGNLSLNDRRLDITELLRGAEIETADPRFVAAAPSPIQEAEGVSLFAHAPSKIRFVLSLGPSDHLLRFGFGVDPALWTPPRGDGVFFQVSLAEHGPENLLFSQYIDPKRRPEDRKWHDFSIDLSSYRGESLLLSLVTRTRPDPTGNNAFCWGGWGDLQLVSDDNQSLVLVYDREIKIYQNPTAFPRAFVVHDFEVVPDPKAILAKMKTSDFDLRTTVLLEEHPGVPNGHPIPGNSTARIVSYRDRSVEVEVEMAADGFLVLSDAFYPGWTVSIDGRTAKLYRANYLLRAVQVSAGHHKVRFQYTPTSFRVGASLSAGSGLLAFGLLGLGKRRRGS